MEIPVFHRHIINDIVSTLILLCSFYFVVVVATTCSKVCRQINFFYIGFFLIQFRWLTQFRWLFWKCRKSLWMVNSGRCNWNCYYFDYCKNQKYAFKHWSIVQYSNLFGVFSLSNNFKSWCNCRTTMNSIVNQILIFYHPMKIDTNWDKTTSVV